MNKHILSKEELNKPVGVRYGRLVVEKFVHIDARSQRFYISICDCGNEVLSSLAHLKSGHTRSCGCFRDDQIRLSNTRHGLRKTPEYNAWVSMKQRCYNKRYARYPDYGGRGIKMCDRWKNSFEAFLEDMGPRPSRDYSLDRYPDNNGNYEPGNTRWALRWQQDRNRRSNIIIRYNGETYILTDLCAKLNLSYVTLRKSIKILGIRGAFAKKGVEVF